MRTLAFLALALAVAGCDYTTRTSVIPCGQDSYQYVQAGEIVTHCLPCSKAKGSAERFVCFGEKVESTPEGPGTTRKGGGGSGFITADGSVPGPGGQYVPSYGCPLDLNIYIAFLYHGKRIIVVKNAGEDAFWCETSKPGRPIFHYENISVTAKGPRP